VSENTADDACTEAGTEAELGETVTAVVLATRPAPKDTTARPSALAAAPPAVGLMRTPLVAFGGPRAVAVIGSLADAPPVAAVTAAWSVGAAVPVPADVLPSVEPDPLDVDPDASEVVPSSAPPGTVVGPEPGAASLAVIGPTGGSGAIAEASTDVTVFETIGEVIGGGVGGGCASTTGSATTSGSGGDVEDTTGSGGASGAAATGEATVELEVDVTVASAGEASER
jgi:hypothetical protein